MALYGACTSCKNWVKKGSQTALPLGSINSRCASVEKLPKGMNRELGFPLA